MSRPLVFFGDETSFGTATALRATRAALRGVTAMFEVDSLATARPALERVGLSSNPILAERESEDRHLSQLEDQLVEALRAVPETSCVFTGKASSIRRLYEAARRAGLPAKQITNVAYWAPGRKGFSGVQR